LGYDRGQKHENSRWQAIFAGVTAWVNERMKKNMAEKELKRKFALWIRPSLLEEVDSLYKRDNCASRSEFMEKALRFYMGYLSSQENQDYLADVIPSTVKGIVDESSNRMGRLLFKLAVEQAVTSNILASVCEVDHQELERLRNQCIQQIRKTNGMISFDKPCVGKKITERWRGGDRRLLPKFLLANGGNHRFVLAKPQNIPLKIEERRTYLASIKKLSDRKFKITISNGYRPSGKKICKAKTITVPDSVKPRSIPQYVAHEAEELERRVKSGYSEDRDTPFETYAARWLDRQVKYAPGTLASYRRMLEVVYPYIGSIKLGELRPMVLENMMIELRKRTSHGKPIQEATVQKYLTVVSAVLSDAKRNEIISKNPARMIDLPETKHRQQFIPTDQQVQDLILALLDEPYHYKLFYVLAMYTGCRRGELCALRWNDFVIVEKYRSVLTVSRSRTVVAGQGVVEGPTKNGRSRTIALSEDMTSLVQGFCYYQREIAMENGRELSPYLFVNEKGQPIHPDTFTKHLRLIFEENGFPDNFHLHTLRHYFVSAMLHEGVDKQTVAELAGHGDTSFLERTYCHPQMKLKQEAAEKLEEALLRF
jgi:integrase